MTPPDSPRLDAAGGAPAGVRRYTFRRTLWHGIGLALAIALAWLIMLAYRQPEFVIDLSNFSLC